MYIVQNDYFCQLAYSQALVVCKKTKLQLTNFFWFFQMNNQMFFKKFINILALCEFQSRLRFWFKELCNELLLLGTNFILLIYSLCILRFTSLDWKKMDSQIPQGLGSDGLNQNFSDNWPNIYKIPKNLPWPYPHNWNLQYRFYKKRSRKKRYF